MSITHHPGFVGMILACAAAAHLAAPRAAGQASSPSLQPSEVRFLQQSYQDVIANQRMAEMAFNQAQTPAVRQLGRNVSRALRPSRDDISNLALKKRVRLSDTLTAQTRKAVTDVSGAGASAFDRTYVDTLLLQISRILPTAQAISKSTRDAALKAYLHRAIPRLKRINAEATKVRAGL